MSQTIATSGSRRIFETGMRLHKHAAITPKRLPRLRDDLHVEKLHAGLAIDEFRVNGARGAQNIIESIEHRGRSLSRSKQADFRAISI